jgi:tetratricopeptide (TPR) repeat protein
LSILAASLQSHRKQADAEKTFREALDIILKLRGQDLAKLPPLVRRVSAVLKSQAKSSEAEKLYEETIQVARQALGDSHPALGELLHDFGEFLFFQQGKFEAAAEQYIKSLPIRRAKQDDNLAWTLRNLGYGLLRAARPQEAETYLRESLALYRKLHQQEEIHGTAWSAVWLADALYQQQKLPEAEQVYREALFAFSKTQGIGGDGYTLVLQSLVRLLKSENKLAEAETLLKDLLSQLRPSPGEQHLTATLALLQLGHILKTQNKADEALNRFREALEIASNLRADATNAMSVNQVSWDLVMREEPTSWDAAVAVELARKAVEATHRKTPGILDTLAAAHAAAGQFTNAVTIQQEAIALLQNEQEKQDYSSRLQLYENNSPYRDQRLLAELAGAWMRDGKFAEAETLLREDLIRVRKLSTNAPSGEISGLGVALHHLADLLRGRKALGEARSFAEEAVALYRRHADWPSSERQHAFWVLADVLEELDDFVSLAPVLDEQLRILRPQFAPDDPELASLIAQLTRTLLAGGKFIQAEPLARECLAIRERKLPDEWRAFSARSMLAGALLGQKKYTEAEPLLLSGYEGMKQREDKIPTEGKPRLKETLQRLVQLYEATGRPDQAAAWKQKLAEFEKRPEK